MSSTFSSLDVVFSFNSSVKSITSRNASSSLSCSALPGATLLFVSIMLATASPNLISALIYVINLVDAGETHQYSFRFSTSLPSLFVRLGSS